MKPAEPLISVVVPAYNGAVTLTDALDSALGQTYKNIEIIVVDDASTDATREVVAGYKSLIQYIRRQENSGICEVARSQGVEMARGEYVAFLDQDDRWLPEKIARQVQFMRENPEYPLCHTYMQVIDVDGKPLHIRHEGIIPPSGQCAEALLRNCFITISSIMVRPSTWLEAACAADLKDAHSDYIYFLSIFKKYSAGIGFIPEVLGEYRVWGQNMSKLNWRRMPRDVLALAQVYDQGHWHGLLDKSAIQRVLVDAYLENAEYVPGRLPITNALWFMVEGLKRVPHSLRLWQKSLKTLARCIKYA